MSVPILTLKNLTVGYDGVRLCSGIGESLRCIVFAVGAGKHGNQYPRSGGDEGTVGEYGRRRAVHDGQGVRTAVRNGVVDAFQPVFVPGIQLRQVYYYIYQVITA